MSPAGRDASRPLDSDRSRWNRKYGRSAPTFSPHPLIREVTKFGFPVGSVLELASGPSGSALHLAMGGRRVIAIDVSDRALQLLSAEARRRRLSPLVLPILADLASWAPPPRRFALVFATRFWDPDVFRAACHAVAPGGLVAWETFRRAHCDINPDFNPAYCLRDHEPVDLLPSDFDLLERRDLTDESSATRRVVARRMSSSLRTRSEA